MRIGFVLGMVAILALPASAAVNVDHEDGVEFASYRTYAWRAGTEAARPQVQQWIVSAVERELKARGLRKVLDRRADLYVVTHAFAEMNARTRANYVHLDVYDVGVITSDVVLATRGTLMIDLLDGDSQRPVWRGMASEVMGDPAPEKLRKKIDKVTRKMFKSFPPD
jgi:hypothetical protein